MSLDPDVPERPDPVAKRMTAIGLGEAIDALEGVRWHLVDGMSAEGAAAFTTRLEEARLETKSNIHRGNGGEER